MSWVSSYTDGHFTALYDPVGQHAEPPWRLALVTLMQLSEKRTDRQAADAVRGRMDGQYALGLALTDAGFDFSVRSKFRTRLITGAAEERLRTTMLTSFRERGLLKERTTQRTDAPHIVAAVRALKRLESVGETLHAALHVLADIAPVWCREQVPAAWGRHDGPRFTDDQLPKAKGDRQALAATIGRDGLPLLTALSRDAAPPYLRAVPAVAILRQVWGQPCSQADGVVHWRASAPCPPSSIMLASPYALDSR